MGIFDRVMGGPPEPAAVERVSGDASHCGACRSTAHPLIQVTLATGPAWVCSDPRACRIRAQAAGIWGVA